MLERYWRLLRIKLKMLVRLRGDRRYIARGVAVGIAMNFIPTVGLGVPVVYWVAGLFRGHKAAAVISTMSIKAFFPLLYIINYIVGELVLKKHVVYTLDWHLAAKAGASFFVGSALNFIGAYIISYYGANWAIGRYKKRRNEMPARDKTGTNGSQS